MSFQYRLVYHPCFFSMFFFVETFLQLLLLPLYTTHANLLLESGTVAKDIYNNYIYIYIYIYIIYIIYVNTSAVLSTTGILNLDIVKGALIFSYVHIIWPLRVSLYGG